MINKFIAIPLFFTFSAMANTPAPDDQDIAKKVPAYMAQDIVNAYEENTISADRKFKGKMFMVAGKVGNIATDYSNTPYVNLVAKNTWHSPRLYFNDTETDKLADLKIGQTLLSICLGDGDTIKSPRMKDCSVVSVQK